jgi:tRNA(Ile2) C34 agmatinyltransferase TiaS
MLVTPRFRIAAERDKPCWAQEEKSDKEIAAEMAKLALVRQRREDAAKKMIEEHGFDIYREKNKGGEKSAAVKDGSQFH